MSDESDPVSSALAGVGLDRTTPIEYQWFLCKYVPDAMRNEPRNVGALVRSAKTTSHPELRFLEEPHFLRAQHEAEFKGFVEYWTKVWDTQGQKAFHWLTRPSKHSPSFRWEHAGSRVARGLVFDELFEILVKPDYVRGMK